MSDVKKSGTAWTKQQERGSLGLIRLMAWIALHCGRRIARWFLVPITLYFVCTSRSARTASKHYLERALGRPATIRDFYRHIYSFASTILDRVYFLNGRFEYFDFRVFGASALEAELAKGRGGFLIGAHVGSFEAVSAVGHQHTDLHVSLLMYEENAKKISSLLRAINQIEQHEIIALGHADSMMKVQQRLDQGGFIGILADRTIDKDVMYSRSFLGAVAQFPAGPFKLAALLRRPVFLMLGLYRGANVYDIYFELIHDFSTTTSKRSEAIELAIAQYVKRLEYHCLSAPYNWFNFYDFWEPPVVGP